jgi:Fe-S-cluster-containing dehydrogenase component/formate-dependent nitrite reductase membrane component NrfD
VQYGFAIDQRTCIGCHACTVACKTEHDIPVGQFRTWVKYVEKGEFPATSREFGVMRCNHCTDAPCVKICPTGALFKREDGIVDFDGERCIGCKSCMQGCPYDAIYIDAESNTAAKCNLCAHRVDQDLEPACVVVCPTHSIWVGDLDDTGSGISRLVNTNPTAVRAPEKDTGPNVFYLGADRAVLDPLAAPVDDTYIWARPDPHRLDMARDGYGDAGARTTLNTAHPRPWGWRVTTYLWTKAVGAGALLFAALALVFGVDLGPIGRFVTPALALAGAASTGALLVWDLKRPERFLYLFLKPNPTSWLVWGGMTLSACAGIGGLWLVFGDFSVLRWPAIPVALLTAGYTAFLFGQAKGRDLWQSPMLFWHLIAQAAMVGTGALLVAAPFADPDDGATRFLTVGMAVSAACHLVFLGLEYGTGHASRGTAIAARRVTRGRYARTFWFGGVLPVVVAIPLVFLGPAAGVVCGLVVQAALVAYESVFVRAGQDVPLS